MERGRTLATLLSQVLAGKMHAADRAARREARHAPEEALRMTLDQVEGRRKLIDADDDRFGRCDICDVDLGAPALGEMPWADRCEKHAAL